MDIVGDEIVSGKTGVFDVCILGSSPILFAELSLFIDKFWLKL